MQKDMWNPFTLTEQEYWHFEFHNCECWLKHEHNIWFVAHQTTSGRGLSVWNNKVPPPSDIRWEQYIVGNCTTIRLLPMPPDRLVVIRPQNPLKILPGEQALFYIPLPVWIKVIRNGMEKDTVAEFPSSLLSQIWFGDQNTGELCYDLALDLADCYMPEHNDAKNENILCPITIANSSQTALSFQRLCLRAIHLSVFMGTESLWTNSVQVIFKGIDQVSQVSYSTSPPAFLGQLEKLNAPRVAPSAKLFNRSFGFLKTFTNF